MIKQPMTASLILGVSTH